MKVSNALAGIAAKDSSRAAEWYSQLLGQPTHTPMPDVYEWKFEHGGVLQVFEDPERAGHASVTLSVADLKQAIAQLSHLAIDVSQETSSPDVSTAQVSDSEGNRVVFAQQHSARIAK